MTDDFEKISKDPEEDFLMKNSNGNKNKISIDC